MSVLRIKPAFDYEVPVLIIGAGACGLSAALALSDAGVEALVLERDALPAGSTALSSGMVPACATARQRERGVTDSVLRMMKDIRAKACGQNDARMVEALCRGSGPALDWLEARHGVRLELVEGFLYPGHTVSRMHAMPERSGRALMGALTRAAERAGVAVVCNAAVDALYADRDDRVTGVRMERPNGTTEAVGCGSVIFACNGFGGNAQMVRACIPQMGDAEYFGHHGNRGDAQIWGEALGGSNEHMGAYQGHGSVATPQRVLITWALMMDGGIQVNRHGLRFSNEHAGYSEQAVAVLSQPGQFVWNIFDARLHELGLQFEDYVEAEQAGALRMATDVSELASMIDVDEGALSAAIGVTHTNDQCAFGRDFSSTRGLEPPYVAVKVTGALFHTQGGLRIDTKARVLRAETQRPLPNAFAGGGAACGVSGPGVSGYLSGNGLLCAIVLGRVAGVSAAAHSQHREHVL